MNVDAILSGVNSAGVDYILIGGMNFLLRHSPELTFDVDIWVEDSQVNLERLNGALKQLKAEWGRTEKEWGPVPGEWTWLRRQAVYCLTTEHGALDIFREVRGLAGKYDDCRARAVQSTTSTGVSFNGLADEDMLTCQEALPESERKGKRVEILRTALNRGGGDFLKDEPEDLKKREELKRDRMYDPVQRWKHIQETITWAEANLPPEKRRNRPRTRSDS
jgi:hypothetical protein